MDAKALSLPENFTASGLLPAGDYPVSLEALRESILVRGPAAPARSPNWDMPWRLILVDQLERVCVQLWAVGIENIYVDGSFVEDKEHPNDIDGYFECSLQTLASGELERNLNLLDEDKIWTWDPDSRRPYRGYPKRQLPMWHKYRVEMYPHVGQLSGIRDELGHDLEFPAAFRKTRANGEEKGIVRITRGGNHDQE